MKRLRDDEGVAPPEPNPATDDAVMMELFRSKTTWLLENYRGGSVIAGQKQFYPYPLVEWVLHRVRPVILNESMLVPVEAPVNICGDIHGQLHDLVELINVSPPPNGRFLFLGDYVDRGKHGVECITMLLGFKVLYPQRIYLLRGNHEHAIICKQYGFFDECRRNYDIRLFKKFADVFNVLPIAGLVEERALCMHGGLSPYLKSFDDIEMIARPYEVGETGLIVDMLWSDPTDTVNGFEHNDERGVSVVFGRDVVKETIKKLRIDLIIRAHQVVDQGYHFFDADRNLVTVFSASNYCGEFTNFGAMLQMDENLICKFRIFEPQYGRGKQNQNMRVAL